MKKSLVLLFLSFLFFAPLSAERRPVAAESTPQENSLEIFLNGKVMQLKNAVVGEKMQLLSIVGVKVFEKRIESSNQEFQLDLPKGYYLVKIGNVVRKISVK
ncbi:MAG: T9SS type A sorting domain-containing protein [Bacteroidales bacterium]|nr:T9SS type A sorting domain-containing protein [Bacteroidales bacterium]